MKLYAQVQTTTTPPLENQPITISNVSIVLGILVAVITIGGGLAGLISVLVKLTTKANDIKANFETMDSKVVHELAMLGTKVDNKFDTLGYKLETGLNYIEKRLDTTEKRLAVLTGRVSDVERYLAKDEYQPRQVDVS